MKYCLYLPYLLFILSLFLCSLAPAIYPVTVARKPIYYLEYVDNYDDRFTSAAPVPLTQSKRVV